MESLITAEVLKRKDELFKEKFKDLFPLDIPDICDLPDDVLMNVKFRDELKHMVGHAYLCLQKY